MRPEDGCACRRSASLFGRICWNGLAKLGRAGVARTNSHAQNESAALMKNGKKKSSGWRPFDKRRTPSERKVRRNAARTAMARRDCDRLRHWRTCPVRQCRRVRGCRGDPGPCMEQRRPKIPEKSNGDPHTEAAKSAPATTVMSAAEAAAAIAASIAGYTQSASRPGEELETIIRDGQ
jgi:hypothetical protein